MKKAEISQLVAAQTVEDRGNGLWTVSLPNGSVDVAASDEKTARAAAVEYVAGLDDDEAERVRAGA